MRVLNVRAGHHKYLQMLEVMKLETKMNKLSIQIYFIVDNKSC